MRTHQWKTLRTGEGKYAVLIVALGDDNWQTIPGIILGGNGKWVIQKGGIQQPQTYKTRNAAAERLVQVHFGI